MAKITRRSLVAGGLLSAAALSCEAQIFSGNFNKGHGGSGGGGGGGGGGPTPPASGWDELKLGSGGNFQSGGISSDGTAVAKADTFGAYVGVPKTIGTTKWTLLSSSSCLPAGQVFLGSSASSNAPPTGVWDVGIAWSNSNYICLMMNGYVLISTNKGATFFQTSVTQDTTELSNNVLPPVHSIAFDPSNPSVCIVGHSAQGVWMSSNVNNGSGGTWAQISTGTLPVSGTRALSQGAYPYGYTGVQFDPTTVVGGKSQKVYVCIWGHGVYYSSNGGSAWALIAASSTGITALDMAQDGYLYAVDGNAGTVYVYKDGALVRSTTPTGSGCQAYFVSADPNTNGRVVIVSNVVANEAPNVSTDHGATWNGWFGNAAGWLTSTDIPWLEAWGNVISSPSLGPSFFDPTQSNVLIGMYGRGVCSWTPNLSAAQHYTDISLGIEQLVMRDLISPAGSSDTVICAQGDCPLIKTSFTAASFPTTYFPASATDTFITEGYHLDWDRNGTGTVIAAIWQYNAGSGQGVVSANNGTSWTPWASFPDTNWGYLVVCVTSTYWVAADPASVVSSGTYNSATGIISLTLGFSATSTVGATVTLTGLTGTGANLNNLNGSWTVATASGTAITLNGPTGQGSITITGGVLDANLNSYVTINGGGSWARIGGTLPTANWAATSWNTFSYSPLCVDEVNGKVYALNGISSGTLYILPSSGGTWSLAANTIASIPGMSSVRLRCAPGNAGHLWAGTSNSALYFTSNAGTTAWSQPNPNWTAVYAFDFGATKPAGTYPALYVYGILSGVIGVYRSNDAGVTYTLLSDGTYGKWPHGCMDYVNAMTASRDTYGYVAIGFLGSGCAQGYFP